MQCSSETCQYCCIFNQTSNQIECIDDILRCRYKIDTNFNKIGIFVFILLIWLFFIPLFFSFLECCMIKKVFR